MHHHGLHHIEEERRAAGGAPHRSERWKREFDELMYAVGVAGPLFVIPQIIQVWFAVGAAGVSPLSWGLLGLGSLLWVVYGVIHKERVIVVSNALFATVDFLVAVGAVLHR